MAVEFVHPVIVGKRALPALGLAGEGGSIAGQVALLAEADDIAIGFGAGEVAEPVASARERGCLTLAFAPVGAEWEFDPPAVDPAIRQELVETLYHVLWELVHVFFDHRGLLEGREARAVHDTGASSFLYPFLGEQETDLEAVVEDVRRSVLAKAAEVGELRAQTLTDNRDELAAAAAGVRGDLDAGGRVLALGNGGSATDAMDVVADLRASGTARPRPDRGLLDPDGDRQRHRDRGDLRAPGDRARARRRRAARDLDQRQLVQRDRRAGRGAQARAAHDRARRLRRWAGRGGGPRRPRDRDPLGAHPAHPGGAGERLPRDAGAVGVSRVRARVEGTVQGVGFRPYVYRLAGELGVAGHVLNDARGVVVEVEAPPETVQRFLARLPLEAPPLATVERVTSEPLEELGELGFSIRESPAGGEPLAAVTPDSATCPDCLAELFDPGDRRFRYPFVNCTNCGPRFTIVRDVPYDRPNTTMAGFEMCSACRREYDDPADRRFHAQPNACPECGPRVRLVGACTAEPVAAAAQSLLAGAIVAVKGIGGYHLACRADDHDAVARLRRSKHREDKPFALMAPSVAVARELVELGAPEEELLTSRARPIVLAPRRAEAAVASEVAPRSAELGVMLPYSPLHHLLAADTATTLVLTSGNVSDEPIAFEDEDATGRLSEIADLFLVHDRPIETRTDDSVVRVVADRPLLLRRSRGYVPGALRLPVDAGRHLLACGAELKNTFAVAKGSTAWVGHHVGDLKNYETLRSFAAGIDHFQRLYEVAPEAVAHDLHPDYLSTRHALELPVEAIGVQHHHAHLAACLAEHGETASAVGAIFDGTGYGADGTVWGGELLFGDLLDFERVGLLAPVRMPGGEAAIRQPWRMACAWLDAPPQAARCRGWPTRPRGARSRSWRAAASPRR